MGYNKIAKSKKPLVVVQLVNFGFDPDLLTVNKLNAEPCHNFNGVSSSAVNVGDHSNQSFRMK
jgi:hypothetical protein